MAKSSKDGLRQRKKAENADGEGNSKPAAKQSSPPSSTSSSPASSAGMTCMNWFIVLFFIIGVSGGLSFFIYNEMTITNRALLAEIRLMKEKSSDTSGIESQINEVTKKLQIIHQFQDDLSAVKENEERRAEEFGHLAVQIKSSQEMFADLTSQFKESLQNIEKMQSEMQDMKSMTSSMQKEIIDLTADKVAMNSAIESIKSTVVAIRERADKQTQQGDDESVKDVIEKLDTRVTGEIQRLSRQIMETSENSAKWLQQSTNEMSQKFQRNIEDLTRQFNEVKVKVQEPTQATADESLVNTVASLDARQNEMKEFLDEINNLVAEIGRKLKSNEQSAADEAEMVLGDITSLTDRVLEVKARDEKLETALDKITKEVTTLSNELNGVKTIARILETRVEEFKTGNSKKAEELVQIGEIESPEP